MNKQSKTMRLTLMGLFAAVLLLMAYTPLGYLNIGPWQSPSMSSPLHWLQSLLAL